MNSANKTVRQSVSLPANVAAQVRTWAKTRRLSSNRMLVELIENGIEAEKRKQQEFFELAERFRNAADPREAKRLGDELGRMVFGGVVIGDGCPASRVGTICRKTAMSIVRASARHEAILFQRCKYRIGVVPNCFRNIDMNALELL